MWQRVEGERARLHVARNREPRERARASLVEERVVVAVLARRQGGHRRGDCESSVGVDDSVHNAHIRVRCLPRVERGMARNHRPRPQQLVPRCRPRSDRYRAVGEVVGSSGALRTGGGVFWMQQVKLREVERSLIERRIKVAQPYAQAFAQHRGIGRRRIVPRAGELRSRRIHQTARSGETLRPLRTRGRGARTTDPERRGAAAARWLACCASALLQRAESVECPTHADLLEAAIAHPIQILDADGMLIGWTREEGEASRSGVAHRRPPRVRGPSIAVEFSGAEPCDVTDRADGDVGGRGVGGRRCSSREQIAGREKHGESS